MGLDVEFSGHAIACFGQNRAADYNDKPLTSLAFLILIRVFSGSSYSLIEPVPPEYAIVLKLSTIIGNG
jgi:hypothetical protein